MDKSHWPRRGIVFTNNFPLEQCCGYHYCNCEKNVSPLKLRCLVLIEQYLLNISGPVYSVHRLFMWLMCLKWHKSIFHTAPDYFKMLTYCDVIATWAGRWQIWRHSDPIVLAGFLWTFLIIMALGSVIQRICKISFIIKRLRIHELFGKWRHKDCGSVNCLASDVITIRRRATRTTWIKVLNILQWRDIMITTCGFVTEIIRILTIWFVESRKYVNQFANRGRITHYSTVWEQKIDHFWVLFPCSP